jgi:hypothetical protein
MRNVQLFLTHLSKQLQEKFISFQSPALIQVYLDELPYLAVELDRSPLRVMSDHQCHCLDGGIFAALALSSLGFPPLILDLVPDPGKDDDHVLAVYQVNGLWGCLAKSNYPVLRSREPVYRTLRELCMSYFDFYFSIKKQKSLRGYTRPMDLSRFSPEWMWDESGIARISRRLYQYRPIPLITSQSASSLSLADERTYQAASLGTDFNWSFGVRPNH